jgi:hypothetical protein
MRRCLPLAALLVACQPSPSRGPAIATPMEASPPVADAPPPDSPAPSTLPSATPANPPAPAQASWLDALDAIDDDGKTVAIANHFSLAPRGDERLLLDLIDVATDRLVRRVIVSDPDHFDSNAGGEAKARRVLAERHWSKLTTYDVEEDPGAPVRQGGLGAPLRANRASGEGLAIEYREPVLVVRDAATGAEILRRTERTWSKSGGSRCPGCGYCPAPLANLDDVRGDRTRHVLLVGIAFQGGTDICWEPPDEAHVVVLPK